MATATAIAVSLSHMWHPEEMKYLETLSETCKELSNSYKAIYTKFKGQQTKYKMPAIILGSVLGLASFGSNQFGQENSQKISLFVGVTSLFISIISSVEAFLKLGENMSGSLVASMAFQKLKERIDVELALPMENRSSNGLVFLRECYQEYQKIVDLAPAVLKRNRYITTPLITPYRKQDISSDTVSSGTTDAGPHFFLNSKLKKNRSLEITPTTKNVVEIPD